MPHTKSSRPARGAGTWTFLLALVSIPFASGAESRSPSPARPIQLREAIRTALLNNRALQIERINPELARHDLSAAYGVYDPILSAQARRESNSDSGAFDPANPAVDSGFETRSDIASFGLGGVLPTGLIYGLNGSYGHSTGSRNFLNFDSHRTVAGIYLQQPLLRDSWIDLPRLTIRVNRRNLQISEQGVRYVAMDILNLVQQGYFDLILAWDTLQIQQELQVTRMNFLHNIRRQIELGALTLLEERVAQSLSARVGTDLISASNFVALAGNQLRTLLGVTGADWDEAALQPVDRAVVSQQNFDLQASWSRALAERPDLNQLTRNVENADLNLKFRRNQLFPSLDIVGSYGRRGASSVQAFPPDQPKAPASEAFDQLTRGDAPNDMVGLVFTMPLTRKTERANHRAGQQLKKQAELIVKQKEELILREISDAIHSARFSFDRLKSARLAAGYAKAALQAEEQKLAGGKSSINFVLQFQADHATARLAEVQAEADYHKALSQVQFTEGSILERNQIDLEFR